MASDNTAVSLKQTFETPFLIDIPKFNRIIGIIEEKYGELSAPFDLSFQIRLKNGKIIDLTNPEEVVKLDNAVHNPVRFFAVKAHNVFSLLRIEYDGEKNGVISLQISSRDSKWSNQLFAELIEQVERTFLSSWMYRYIKLRNKLAEDFPLSIMPPLLGLFMAVVLGTVFLNPPRTPLAGLPKERAESFHERSKSIVTYNDRVQFLFDLETSRLEYALASNSTRLSSLPDFRSYMSVRSFFVIIPIFLIITCAYFVSIRCYPSCVFLWGDYIQHYDHLVFIRRNLWLAVVISTLLGVMSNLFVIALSPSFG
jgi:hypothetical protein